jgi:alcohol dehydrogenase class IV
MKNSTFFMPTRVVFGKKTSQQLNAYLVEKYRRIMVVSDPFLATKTPIVKAISAQIADRLVTQFDRVEENPTIACIEDGRRVCLEHGCDLVIGIGGGSAMDAAKGIALLALQTVGLKEILNGAPAQPGLPIVCIPTTSGTGSEVTPYAVFTDTEDNNKCGYAHDSIFPIVSLIDPDLTYSMPETLIIDTGLDVITHALESFLCTIATPASDAVSLESLRLALPQLPAARLRNTDAMDTMSYASMLAGMAITLSSTILLHIMAYPLTVYHHISHGRANAILLPAFLDFMQTNGSCPERVKIITDLFAPFGGVRQYLSDLNVSYRLVDYGIHSEEFPTFAAKTIVKGDIKVTPAQLSQEIIQTIYEAASL